MINLAEYAPWLPLVAIIAAVVLLVMVITENIGVVTAILTFFAICLITILVVWFIDYARDEEWIVYEKSAANVVVTEEPAAAPTQTPKPDAVPPTATTQPTTAAAQPTATAVNLDGIGNSDEIIYPQCPAGYQTREDIASKVGGDVNDWGEPEGTWGAWVFRSGNYENLRWPGFGYIDTGVNLQKDVTNVKSASFHCEAPPTS